MVLDKILEILGTKNSVLLILVGLTVLVLLFFPSRRRPSSEKKYYRTKGMRRSDLERQISSLEKEILKFDKNITEMKIKEHDLEIGFSSQRDEKLQKELQKLRRNLTEMANRRDKLLQQKYALAKAYREVTL